jgi:Fur family peroxide stress response transcriptional regulator
MNLAIQRKKYKGLQLTAQRLAILGYLEGNKEHPTAREIYKNVSKKFPTMSFATVYKTLEILVEKGYLVELNIEADKRRFDPNTEPHHHLICTRCKKIVDLHRNFDLSIPDSQKEDFEIIGNRIEFFGICPKCRTKK